MAHSPGDHSLKLCALAVMLTASIADGRTLDNFTAGPLASGPPTANVSTTQSGLDPSAAIGGGRQTFLLYGGELRLGDGRLEVDLDDSFFEVAQFQYGSFAATLPDLNADFTQGDADRLLIRVSEAVFSDPSRQARILATVSSGNDTSAEAFGGGAAKVLPSTEPFTLAIPFEELGAVDLTDVDGFGFALFLDGPTRLVIDEVVAAKAVRGDLNADGVVNDDDLGAYASFYGSTATLSVDANLDGVVNAADYTAARDALAGLTAAVPEPTGFALLACGCGMLKRRRRLLERLDAGN